MSSPATPSHELLMEPEEWRFEDTGAACEWAEDYRPGGFHPVNIGDTFANDQYKVIRKLGEGSFSTVWLVASKSVPRYAALKIVTARSSDDLTELAVLDKLSTLAPEDPDTQYVTLLLDKFSHVGPNGIHQCLVFDAMSATAATLVEELPENLPKMRGIPQRYPKWIAKRMLLQLLRALSLLHRNGIVHSDVQPGNLLFSIEDLDGVEQQELKQNVTKTAIPLTREDGKTDRWAPSSLYLQEPLHSRANLGPELYVKLSDFGAAFFVSNPPKRTATPLGLRAPELILNQPFDSGIDIWAFGCLIYEFLTGQALFVVMMFGYDQEDRETTDDTHLTQLNDKIRRLPKSMMDDWPRAGKWFDSDYNPLHPYGYYDSYQPLEQRFAKYKPADVDDEEAAVICQLIREILVYDPTERPSAADLLKQPWFLE